MTMRIQFGDIEVKTAAGLVGWLVVWGSLATPVQGQDQTPQVATATSRATLDRTILPIPEPSIPHSTVFDARKATPPPRFQVTAPAGAPNVLIVLI
ncbi:MAG TPA: hypothetical protein VIY86_13165, partial [Pirellulaceae bacterium]